MHFVGLCDDHQPTSFFVYAMDNARSSLDAKSTQVLKTKQQRIYQGSAIPLFVASSCMHDHPGWFVYDSQVFVLIYNVEWNFLWCSLQRRTLRFPANLN